MSHDEPVGFVKANGAGEIIFRQGHPANFPPPWRPVYARVDQFDIRAGLVGKHERLYVMSADFHAAVDTLAQMLPAMVDGLAAAARERGAATSAAVRDALLGISRP